jgi:CheY-like chemotaxis protein
MSNKGKILIVDDEPFNCEIMQEILENDYDLSVVNNGQECLDIAPAWQPDVILLDISMPGMSGYDACKQLKGNVKTKDIQITFVSALDTLADRLAGYEVGGDDYITKPFDAQELHNKVKVAFKNKVLQRQLENDADKAKKAALSAITSTNEIGMMLQFLSATFHCNDYDSLAQLIVDTIDAFGYRSTVQIRAENKEVNKSSEGTINPLEVAVINRISAEDDHLDIGPRTIMNFRHVSILVKGMPVNDEEGYEQVKENMAVIAEGTEMRIGAIEARNALLGRAGLLEVMRHAQQTLSELNNQHSEHKRKISAILQQLQTSVHEKLQSADFDAGQMEELMSLFDHANQEVVCVYQDKDDSQSHVSQVMEELQAVINR